MKKILFAIIALCAFCASAAAQDTWFCGNAGSKLSYTKTDAQGNKTNFDYIIKDKVVDGGRTTISFVVVIPNLQNTPVCSVWSEGGMFHMDASAVLGQFGEGIKVSGNAPVLPESPVAGQSLEDCSINIDALMLTSEYKKVKFTGEEEITVPAGTFKCWCLEYDVVSKVMGLKAENHVQEWVAKGIGDVKVVSKDKRGRVVSNNELVAIAK